MAKKIDLIQYGDRIIVNMLNIGLDCEVVTKMEAIKEKSFFRALGLYCRVAVVFAGNEGYNLKVTLEDGRGVLPRVYPGSRIENGAFCGGGF